ncbi:CLUMA_CG000514, isoform A [Clunio marinus]|uniref:CLUMA_CG000514, isoform A n=1 Tax=Clunio marinus TaxID=568069 RepID=A0A1J1HKB0_9DIPT|nr:CLUMA_CG000514, isoform A [Clunio marinus]
MIFIDTPTMSMFTLKGKHEEKPLSSTTNTQRVYKKTELCFLFQMLSLSSNILNYSIKQVIKQFKTDSFKKPLQFIQFAEEAQAKDRNKTINASC